MSGVQITERAVKCKQETGIQRTWAEEDGGVGKHGVLRARPFSMKAGTTEILEKERAQ